MSIDEAIKQLSFHKLKGSKIIREVLEEAQELAVKQHNIEFKSNLWICKLLFLPNTFYNLYYLPYR